MTSRFAKPISEFLGTFAIVFFGCGTAIIAPENSGILVPAVFGMTVALMIYALGHLSGAHFNPTVTLAFAVTGRFPWKELPVYWIAQCTAALAACLALSICLADPGSFGATIPATEYYRAVVIEGILSFFLMLVIISVATDSRAVGIMAGMAIGGTVMVDAAFGGSLTGASMNFARSLGPAIFNGSLSSLWVYFVGPCIGMVTAAWLYESIRCEAKVMNKTKQDAAGCC